MYTPGNLPSDAPAYLRRELQAIAIEAGAPVPRLRLDVLHSEPSKPRDGDLVMADGTNWNPGAGAGVYARTAGAWVKL